MRRRLAQHGDEGFTLIEVLVVIVILPLVVGAIAAGMMSLFTNSGTTQTRLADSHDAQITSTYFVRDIQSAQKVSTSTAPLCGTAAQLLGVSWSSLTSSGTVITNAATYSVDPSADTLVRTFCANGSTSTAVLAHNAFVASPAPSIGACPGVGVIGVGATSCALTGTVAHAAVTVTCTDGTITCTNAGSLAATPQTSGAVAINLVRLDVLEQSGFVYNLTASPRGWTTAGANLPGPGDAGSPALALIGTNPGGSFQGSGACTLNVNGVAAINTGTSGAVTQNKNDFTATGGIISQTTSPITGPGAPTATLGPPLADPYAGLVPPKTTDPGVHVITQSSQLSGQLDGVYIIQTSVSLSGNTKLTTGPNGVLLYVTSGSLDLTGGSSVSLTSPVASYAPIVIWIDKNDAGGGVKLGGNGNVQAIGGTIYAPTGSVTLSGGGNGGGASANAIIANYLGCQGGGNGVGFSAGPPATNTVVTSSPNPSADGQPTTVTAQVNAIGSTVSTGQVLFVVKDKNGTQTADCATAATVSVTGEATCVTGNLSAASGPYTITAYYQGNAAFSASTSAPLTQNVRFATSTAIAPNPAPSVPAGSVVTYTATVTPTGGPAATGSVTFAGVTCTNGQTQTLAAGQASCQSAALHVAGSPYSVTASYGGSPTDAPSTSEVVSQKVTTVGTTTSVTSTPNPSGNHGAVTFIATVSSTGPSGAVPNDGTVTWTFGLAGASCAASPVSAGTASCSIGANVFTPGTYSVQATYIPGTASDYQGSSGTESQEVSSKLAPQITTSLTLKGNTYTDKATLTGTGGTPTGSVTFYLCTNATTMCTNSMLGTSDTKSLASGSASTTTQDNKLSSGSYCFAAYYSGDSNYAQASATTGQCFTVP